MRHFWTAFRAFCRLSLEVYISRNFYKATRNSNSSWLVFPHCFLLLTIVDSGLQSDLDLSLLLSVLDCFSASLFVNWPFLGSFANSLSGFSRTCLPPLPVLSEISSPSPLFGFAPKQTKRSSAWRTTHIVSHLLRKILKMVKILWLKYLITALWSVIDEGFLCLWIAVHIYRSLNVLRDKKKRKRERMVETERRECLAG